METLDRLQPYVLSLLRIMVGLLFMQHGLSKLFGFPAGAGFPAILSLPWFEGWIEMIGGPKPDSTNHADPLSAPPVRNPRARTVTLVGKANPPSCQPPAMRAPSPRFTQSAPLVQASKVVRQTSGLAPSRSQVITEPSKESVCVAGSVLTSRTT